MNRKTAKGKTKNKRIAKYLIDVSVLIFVFGFSIIFLLRKPLFKNNSFNNALISPTPTQAFPVDTENDGIYTNYKYEFRFNYPEDIFTSYNPLTNSGIVVGANMFDGNKKYWLSVRINGQGSGLDYFNEFENLQVGVFENEENFTPHHRKTKVKELLIDTYKGFLLYGQLIDKEVDAYQGYSISLLKNTDVITVSVLSLPAKDLSDAEKNEKLRIVNGIINSFEFF